MNTIPKYFLTRPMFGLGAALLVAEGRVVGFRHGGGMVVDRSLVGGDRKRRGSVGVPTIIKIRLKDLWGYCDEFFKPENESHWWDSSYAIIFQPLILHRLVGWSAPDHVRPFEREIPTISCRG